MVFYLTSSRRFLNFHLIQVGIGPNSPLSCPLENLKIALMPFRIHRIPWAISPLRVSLCFHLFVLRGGAMHFPPSIFCILQCFEITVHSIMGNHWKMYVKLEAWWQMIIPQGLDVQHRSDSQIMHCHIKVCQRECVIALTDNCLRLALNASGVIFNFKRTLGSLTEGYL